MVQVWIEETSAYHTIEYGAKNVYHDGGWICSEGEKIKAKHLVNSKGTGRIQCDVCKAHAGLPV